MKIASVIAVRNEGAELRATIESLRASVIDAELLIIVADDGSTDGSVDFAVDMPGIDVITFDKRGCNAGRNAGFHAAKAWGADAVSFHDGHMRFSIGGIEILAAHAIKTGVIACAASAGMKGNLAGNHCELYYNVGTCHGLQPRWKTIKDRCGWVSSPCMMGAGYALSMSTATALETETGQLWDSTVGVWGFTEQALALKCFLMGISIEFNLDVVFSHDYRQKSTQSNVNDGLRRNFCHSTALLLSAETYEMQYRPLAKYLLGDELEAEISASAQATHPGSVNVEAERDIWTRLLGDSPAHARSTILPDIVSVCFYEPCAAVWEALADVNIHTHLVTSSDYLFNTWNLVAQGKPNFKLTLCPPDDDAYEQAGQDVDCIIYNSRDTFVPRANRCITEVKSVTETTVQTAYEHILNMDGAKYVISGQPDPFLKVLEDVAAIIQPECVLEWGPGRSTAAIISGWPDVQITSIEHQERFYEREKKRVGDNVNLVLAPLIEAGPSNYESWPLQHMAETKFDMIFVDGRRRIGCLLVAREVVSADGFVLLHNARRKQYRAGIALFEVVSRIGQTYIMRRKLEECQ